VTQHGSATRPKAEGSPLIDLPAPTYPVFLSVFGPVICTSGQEDS